MGGILAKLQAGLSARRIHQDLGGDLAGFGYDSVRRFIQRLGRTRSLPYRRMECAPGAEAQVDFGTGAFVMQPDGKRRKTHVQPFQHALAMLAEYSKDSQLQHKGVPHD